ncbi:MAG: oligosaccharide flippase family protein [Actinomycetota bacterium]
MSQLSDRLRQSLLVRNTVSMFAGHMARTLIQAGYFIIIARLLGSKGYGAFVGVAAFVAILAPFASIGSGNVMIKNVARDPQTFSRYWGNAKLITFVSGSVFSVLIILVSRFALPPSIPLVLVISITASDLIFSRVLDVSAQAFQAFEKLGRTAQLMVTLNMTRLIGAAALLLSVKHAESAQWGFVYLTASGISAMIALRVANTQLGRGRRDTANMLPELREGALFSVSLSAQSIYNDIDKTMLAKLSTLGATGIYGAAYRIIDVAFTPVRSLLYAGYARFFQHGTKGVKGSLAFAKRLLPIAAIYALAVGGLLIVSAPLVPRLIGKDFSESVLALRWLAFLPLLKSFHYFAADTLTGAGKQGTRSAIQAGVAVFNVGINLWLITSYSWRGAAWSSLASDGLLALTLWIVVIRIGRGRAGV